MERRLAVHAGARRQALIAALLLAAAPASAAPKDAEARKLFDRGVAAYTKGDLAGAAQALSESYAREGDPETLFAWAQAERKLGHCESAIELYNTLLAFELPAANKKVVEQQLAECNQIVSDKKNEPVAPPPPSPPPATTTTTPAPAIVTPPPSEPAPAHEGRAWWRDPVGDGLVIGGVVGLGVGTGLLLSARSADAAKDSAMSYSDFKANADTAHDRGIEGVIGLAAGGVLLVGGIAWYATHRDGDATAVTGWLAPRGGGIGIGGAF